MNQPCLPVPRRRKRNDQNDGPSFDNIESMDAEEYMAAVVQQANAMPEYFVATTTTTTTTTTHSNHSSSADGSDQRSHQQHVPIHGSAASLEYLVSHRTAVLPPPSIQHVPLNCREWVDGTLANFSSLREYLEKCQKGGVGGKLTERIPVPPMRDNRGWLEFCLGQEESNCNHINEGDTDIPGVNTDDDLPAWRSGPPIPITGHVPTVDLLLQIDQVMLRRILPHLVPEIGSQNMLSPQRTAWLYALLSRLERPVHRDDAATLFGLLKRLTVMRSELSLQLGTTDSLQEKQVNESSELLARLNVLICITGLYFEQGGGFDNIFGC